MTGRFTVSITSYRIRIGKRTLQGVIGGLILGVILFVNNESFSGFMLGSLVLGYAFGVLGVTIENLSVGKALLVWLILVAPVAAVAGMNSIQLCKSHAVRTYETARNPISGEVEEKMMVGDLNCEKRFPWYYEDLSQAEVNQYCEQNPETRFCRAEGRHLSPDTIRGYAPERG